MPKRKSNTEELTDRLIYKNKNIKTNDILMILFGCSLGKLKEAERWTPESREKERLKIEKAVAKAKKAEGIHLVSEPACWRPPVVIPPAKPKRKIRTGKELKELKLKNERLVVVGTAFRKFKHWVWIAFHDDTSVWYLANEYPTQEFFRWVVENNILKELKKLGIATTDRACRFIGFAEAERADVSPATQEEIKPLSGKSSKLKKPKQKGLGGKPSKPKINGIRRLKKLFKNKLFKKAIKGTLNKELPFTRQVLTVFIDDPDIAVTPKLIEKIKGSDDYFKEIFGTTRRNFIDRWIPEVRG